MLSEGKKRGKYFFGKRKRGFRVLNGFSNLLDCVVVIIVHNYAIVSSFPAL
jgi:hypothetical protein